MPLLDHFHPPLTQRRSWEGFHSLWAAAMVEELNSDVLNGEFYADMHVHIGSPVEVDVATLTERQTPNGNPGGATATLAAPAWSPPATKLILPTVFPDDIEVQVFATTSGSTLVAAIELVSPANKDRPDARHAFAAKCVAYLTRGIGLIVVDVVTNRLTNLHNDVIAMLGHAGSFLLDPSVSIYATAYRPSRQVSGDQIEIWPEVLAVGGPLPVLPLALRNAETVPLNLEETYTAARSRSRLT